MGKYFNIIMSLISGILFGLSWPEITHQTWLIFFAFIPLFFIIENLKYQQWRLIFIFSFISFFIWHLIAVYWMIFSTVPGSLSAWIVNSFLMAGVILLSHFSSKRLAWFPREIILIFYWLSFEILHLFWDLSWPWMNLGHAFANQTNWIQWYEFLGVYGGGAWVILVNGIIFRMIQKIKSKSFQYKNIIPVLIAVFIPISISYFLIYIQSPAHENESLEISIVQPNIDTYDEKFNGLTPLEQSDKVIKLLNENHIGDLVLLPETVVPKAFDINTENYPESVQNIMDWGFMHQKIIIGGFHLKDSLEYNAALAIESNKIVARRNKLKLLPFAEKVPFESWSALPGKFIVKTGGVQQSLSSDKNVKTLELYGQKKVKLGVIICFESAFQDVSAAMALNGAEAILIITNDDWWRDTPGYRQHFAYARIRAIETRRSIARSANTGKSGFINQYGQIISFTKYRVSDVITQKINLQQTITFFSKYESSMRWIIVFISLIFLLISITQPFLKKLSQLLSFLL